MNRQLTINSILLVISFMLITAVATQLYNNSRMKKVYIDPDSGIVQETRPEITGGAVPDIATLYLSVDHSLFAQGMKQEEFVAISKEVATYKKSKLKHLTNYGAIKKDSVRIDKEKGELQLVIRLGEPGSNVYRDVTLKRDLQDTRKISIIISNQGTIEHKREGVPLLSYTLPDGVMEAH